MSDINSTILVPIDLFTGSTAVNYAPSASNICPILSLLCVSSNGSGDIKITPIRAAELNVEGDGTGARLRIATDGTGAIKTVEIASGGSGYTDGPVPVSIVDPYGTGAEIACTVSGGVISSASIVSPGQNYSGYVLMDVSDFIEGVTYNIVPRLIEQTSGNGVLKLLGSKLSFRPFQVF